MNVVTIQDPRSGAFARIAVHFGFNCFQFRAQVDAGEPIEVIAAAEGFENGGFPASYYGIPILFPFTNRIRDGRFSWNGRDYFLPPSAVPYDGTGNAIHGFCSDVAWRVVDQQQDSVTGEFQAGIDAPERRDLWPGDLILRITYTVTGTSLKADISITNPSSEPVPWGFGTHPYFRVPLSEKGRPENCTVTVPVERVWELEQFLPTGRKVVPPETEQLNHSPWFDTLKVDAIYTDVQFTESQSVCRIVDEQGSLQVEQRSSADFRDIVVFTPPWMSAICLEPYTCVTDAINLQQRGIDAGLQVLAPGASWNGSIVIELQPVTA